ncbi:ferritin light chain [Sander vitreus]
MAAEPTGKRLKSGLPLCAAHRSSAGSRARHNLPAAVEEALCGLSSLLWDGAYRLQALVGDTSYCSNHREDLNIYYSHIKPGCEAVCSVLPALELLLLQLKEEAGALVELSQLARNHGDPHTASVVKSHFLAPRVDRLTALGDLLTSARRLGCTNDQTGAGGFGEYILNQLQDELAR